MLRHCLLGEAVGGSGLFHSRSRWRALPVLSVKLPIGRQCHSHIFDSHRGEGHRFVTTGGQRIVVVAARAGFNVWRVITSLGWG